MTSANILICLCVMLISIFVFLIYAILKTSSMTEYLEQEYLDRQIDKQTDRGEK